jgi:hypothetical protein
MMAKNRAKRASSRTLPASDPAVSDSWSRMKSKYRGHPSWAQEAVYALPHALTSLIAKKLPRFFAPEEEQFERDLADAGAGFFKGWAFAYPPLGSTGTTSPPSELDERVDASTKRVLQLLEDDMKSRGVSEPQIRADLERSHRELEVTEEVRWGYAGWLVTSPEFRRQCQHIKAGAVDGNPPRLPLTFTGYADEPTTTEGVLAQQFLRSWAVEGFATWELPIPLRPELSSPALYDIRSIAGAGVTVFVPWYLLRHRTIDLYALFDARQRQHMPPHLGEWFNNSKWGPPRYLRMLRLYVYLELGLRRRYANRVERAVRRIDECFGQFFKHFGDDANEESVRVVRLELQKRLKPTRPKR